MQISLKRELGNSLLNAIRGAAYVSYPVIRPIGFKVGSGSTVVGISDNVLEDMTTFIGNLDVCVYSYGGNRHLIEAKAVCDGELMISELLEGTGISTTSNPVVLHSMSPIEVSVVFSFSAGNFLINENAELLKNAGYCDYVAVNSRHCVVKSFTFKRIDSLDGKDIFDVSIETVDGTDPQLVFNRSAASVCDELKPIVARIS